MSLFRNRDDISARLIDQRMHVDSRDHFPGSVTVSAHYLHVDGVPTYGRFHCSSLAGRVENQFSNNSTSATYCLGLGRAHGMPLYCCSVAVVQ